ncbi:hypothetical protein PBI_GRAYSON_20 [Rhodococcus phage Grayson]|nr:hypothetical protein PBI_GRAYSON_20 [Rhodococcus phage Grayson]
MIKVSEVAEEVRRLAKASPYFQYEAPGDSCKYLEEKDGERVGSCIVGQALVNLGLDKDTISKYEYESAYAVLQETCEVDSMTLLEWVDFVQDEQDAGRPWENCVFLADIKRSEDEY